MSLIKRVCAYIVDYLIISILTIVISMLLYVFAIKETVVSNIFIIKFSLFFIDYKLTIFWLIYEIISIFLLTIFVFKNNGLTIGDKMLKLEIKSLKFKGIRLYFLRFAARELTIFFIQVFVFVNLIYMIIKKSINVVWYDDLLGINVKNICSEQKNIKDND